MEKYEWLWESLKKHKRELVEKFDGLEKITPEQVNARIQHNTVLNLMEYLELKEPESNA